MAQIELVIVTYNNPHLILACVASLARSQVFDADLCRLVVVNNGHPDAVRGLAPAPWLTVVQAPRNLGWEGGLTEGIRHTTAPLIGLVNDDILVPPQSAIWLRHLIAWFRDPAVGAVGPSSNYVAGCQSLFWNPQQMHLVMQAPFLIGFCAVIRRSAWEQIGGMDLTLPGGDDIDWSIRLRQAGYTLLADRAVFIYHHGQQTGRKEHGDFWNSSQMLEPIHDALIRKHGFAAYWDCIQGQATPYRAPWMQSSGSPGSEEVLLGTAMPTDGPILDVGCGGTKVLPHAIGVDIQGHGCAVPQLAGARSLADVTCDLNTPLPFADQFASGIVAKHILEHLLNPLAVLQDWHRVLQPRGKLAVAVPDATKTNGIALNPEHKHDFTPSFLTALVEAAGFSHVQIHDPQNGISFVLTAERNGVA